MGRFLTTAISILCLILLCSSLESLHDMLQYACEWPSPGVTWSHSEAVHAVIRVSLKLLLRMYAPSRLLPSRYVDKTWLTWQVCSARISCLYSCRYSFQSLTQHACYFARSTNLAPSTAYERLQHMSYIIISTDSKQKSAIPHTIQYGYTMFLLVVLQLQCEVQRPVKCMSRYVDLIVNTIRS